MDIQDLKSIFIFMTVFNGGIICIMRIAIWLKSNASQDKNLAVPQAKSSTVGFSLVGLYNVLWVILNLAPMTALIYISS